MSAPVESKVTAASAAALIAAAVVGYLVVKLPGLSGLADPLQALVTAVITAALTFAAGWLGKHALR
ncbi:hypothetical protein AB0L06_29580 [Spirillospora sp. NPDC052269]